MNCEPGDLAVIVRSTTCPATIGTIIRVTNLRTLFDGQFWEFEGGAIVVGERAYMLVADECLRPLRDKPGTDETLIWAGLPRQTSPAQPLTT